MLLVLLSPHIYILIKSPAGLSSNEGQWWLIPPNFLNNNNNQIFLAPLFYAELQILSNLLEPKQQTP